MANRKEFGVDGLVIEGGSQDRGVWDINNEIKGAVEF